MQLNNNMIVPNPTILVPSILTIRAEQNAPLVDTVSQLSSSGEPVF